MFLAGKAAKYFLDELDDNLGNYTKGHLSMFATNPDYLKIKELYNTYDNKNDARFIIQEALNEFDRSRHNIKPEEWQMTNDHYCELYESFPCESTLEIIKLFYQELYERDNKIMSMCKEQHTSMENILKIFLDKGL